VTKILSFAQLQMMDSPELPELPDFMISHTDPLTGEDNAGGPENPLGFVTTRLPPLQTISRDDPDTALNESDPSEWEGQVSRNAPCPCGSGQKYKHCHGAL
jgi:preprotein translocase subunit SecA